MGDEMYVKEGNKHTGELLGYCDIGDINNHLHQLEMDYTHENSSGSLVIGKARINNDCMGLFTSFVFPYASFATSTLTGEQKAIMRIEKCSFKVLCLTLDGNSIKSFTK